MNNEATIATLRELREHIDIALGLIESGRMVDDPGVSARPYDMFIGPFAVKRLMGLGPAATAYHLDEMSAVELAGETAHHWHRKYQAEVVKHSDARAMLAACAGVFRDYEKIHASKGTPEGTVKAIENGARAKTIEDFLGFYEKQRLDEK